MTWLFFNAVNFFSAAVLHEDSLRHAGAKTSSCSPLAPMDDHAHLDRESDCALPTESASYAGAFFPNSCHLVVEGGTFTSHNTIASLPADYLRLLLGSIDLRKEICFDAAAGVVSRNDERRGKVRRTYSARVGCRSTPMTVVLYQGDDAEKEWRKSVSVHSSLRHPNIVQLYATASSSGIHAAIYHDGAVYICAYVFSDRSEALRYCNRPRPFQAIPWVRRSTGRLCIEFGTIAVEDEIPFVGAVERLTPPDSIQALHDPNQESRVIAALGFQQWYSLCRECLAEYRYSDISVQAEVKLNSIMHWSSGCQFEDATEMAWVVAHPVPELKCWNYESLGKLQEDGSVRYNSSDVFGKIISTTGRAHDSIMLWLPQANYIFTQLKIPSDYKDYVLVDSVDFYVQISLPEHKPPNGYLFLCPPTNFQTGSGSFQWPECPAYWSLDPVGRKPLSVEEAANLGFPPIELTTEVGMFFWDETVYAALCKFHVEKGFDPNRQDVAHELGYPLYELSIPVANVPGQDLARDRNDESEHSSSHTEDDPLRLELAQEFPCCDTTVGALAFGELVVLLKFVLIVAVAVMHLFEHVRRQIS
ncbi:hypothetical protein MSAN_02017200 [Mycena sanguinolenta]|uniref:Protein kinase domain-containing protein n=1 Tax=Mycena sanguinolenta TaxID=230812 RepID=A0A8H6XLR3_9AGAR|nr:hypothetical protein MSAN_02017200 [Mycena sanguinolenta]